MVLLSNETEAPGMPNRRVILLGPPGSGKGTQATKLCAALNMRRLATGDLLRQAIQRNTPVGRLTRPFMESGGSVPDDVLVKLIHETMKDLAAPRNESHGGY